MCDPYIHIAGIDVVGVLLSRNHVQHHSVEVICTINNLCMSCLIRRFSPHVIYMYYVCMDFSHMCVLFMCLHIIGGASADTVWSSKSRFIL